jgi:DNA-binding NarL/FixJ family response regulator
MTTSIVLAINHALFREALRQSIEAEADLQVVGEAGTGHEAIELVREQQPNVVLMDLSAPELDGVAVTRSLRAEFPDLHVVILSGGDADASVVAAVRAGAIGYLCRTASIDDLLQTIASAAIGQVTLSAAASAQLVQELHAPDDPTEHLTDRELDVLTCVVEGLANKEIAWKLRISEKTVKSHVSTILGKFGLQSRTQAALHATRVGLVSAKTPVREAPARTHAQPIISFDSHRLAHAPRTHASPRAVAL